MGRRMKERLDYFPMDVDMFRDPKIMRLIRKDGAEAVAVYTLLLCRIYEQGYWARLDDDLQFMVAADASMEDGVTGKIINDCVYLGLFDRETFMEHGVLTSRGIQERYVDIKGKCKNKAIITDYRLISIEETEGSEISSEEMPESEQEEHEKRISSEEMQKNAPKKGFIRKKCPENEISSEEMPEKAQNLGFPLKNKEKDKDKNINSPSTSLARESVGQRELEESWYVGLANDEGFVETAATRNQVGVDVVKRQLSAFWAEAEAKRQCHNSEADFRSHAFDWVRRSVEIAREKQAKRSRGSASSGCKPAAVGVVEETGGLPDKSAEEREMIIETFRSATSGDCRSAGFIAEWQKNGRLAKSGFRVDVEGKNLYMTGADGKEVMV